MTRYVAPVRAANVGGTGKLPMAKLKAMCVAAGFGSVATYIASGNVVFSSRLKEQSARSALEDRLQRFAGKPVSVIVRTADEMAAVLAANPFPDRPANSTVAIFLSDAPPVTPWLERPGAVRKGLPSKPGRSTWITAAPWQIRNFEFPPRSGALPET